MSRYGYHGTVLHVDLSAQTVQREYPGERFWRIYAGGGLLAAYYLQVLHPGPRDAYDPANPLIFASSVLAGHPYAGLARFTVAARSPLTGGIGEARGEGPFPIALKGSGADAIVVRGRAAQPMVLVIEEGQAALYAADNLWGMTVSQADGELRRLYGGDIHTAIIGPAGENRVRFASIVADCNHQAARMGMGAVMGSKNLKAVVIRGDVHPPVANPARCAALTEAYRQRMLINPLTLWQLEPPGFAAWVHTHGTDAALCTRNYRDSVFESAIAYTPDRFLKSYRGMAPCPGCPNNCIKRFSVDPDQAGAGGIHQEITGALGSNVGLVDLKVLFAANVRCNELGMDPNSLGFTLSMAMECAQERIYTAQQVEIDLRFGDGQAILAAIELIAYRRGFGAVLAEGARRAADMIGGGAERFALHVKGLEMVPFEPRTQTNLALGYAVAPIGPRYDICEHDWDYDTRVGWEHTLEHSRTLGILDRIPMQQLSVEKVRNYKALSTIWSAADALDFCIFAIAPTRVFSLQEMADMLSAVTGWDTSAYEIMRWGERRLHLMRMYNLGAGLTAADDTLPARFFDEPIHEGDWAGTRLEREKFDEAVRAYYFMMGWDLEGRPRRETLIDHHLEWAAL